MDISNTLADLDEELMSDSKLSEESKRGVHDLGETLDTHSWGDLVIKLLLMNTILIDRLIRLMR